MAEGQMMTAADVLATAVAGECGDLLRDAVAAVVRELIEAAVSVLTGAQRGERTPERVTHLNGYRPRLWETRVGELELAIPRARSERAYSRSFREPRRRYEQAIAAVVMGAYVNGVSTRKVRRAAGHPRHGQGSRQPAVPRAGRARRAVRTAYRYLWLDAKPIKVRDRGRVLS